MSPRLRVSVSSTVVLLLLLLFLLPACSSIDIVAIVRLMALGVAESILDLIGQTPLLHLSRFIPQHFADVYAKLEWFNPGGSVKDRAALGMILDAEERGLLKPARQSSSQPPETPESDWRWSELRAVTVLFSASRKGLLKRR